MFINLKNQKGSALTYVLIIMMLLSILGLALISSTVINFKVNRQSNSFNKSFYITDGAIDETLAELKEITYRAEADASNWINDPNSNFRIEEKWIDFLSNTNTKLESGELSSEQVVDLTQTALEREFAKRYYQFLLEVKGGVDAKKIYEEDYQLYDKDNNFVEDSSIILKSSAKLKEEYEVDLTEVSFSPSEAANFISASIDNIKLVTTIEDNFFSLRITSNGAYNENKKVVEVELDVIVPNYNYIVSTESKNIVIHKNEALTNAIMAREDIIIVDGKVTVNGDIYSYGTFPEVQEYSYSDVGGIIVGADKANLATVFTSIGDIDYTDIGSESIKGELVVDGDIQSRSSIRVNGDNSKISSNGSIYANSFVVDKYADDFIGSTDGNLYIMEDMLLFGDDSSVKVGKDVDSNGELWTFLEGSPSGSNRGVRDLSGSIIVNNDSSNLKLTTNNYFISGVAYIDIYRMVNDVDGDYKAYYQSGESFTTNNSNNFYTKKIASTDKSTEYFEYIIARGPDTGATANVVETYETISKDGVDLDVVVNDVNYKATHFITKNNEIIDGYESYFAPISDRDKNIFTINSLASSNDNNNYAIGVVLGNTKIFNPYAVSGDDADTFVNMPFNDFLSKKEDNVEKLDKKVSLLATRDYTNGENDDEKFDEIFNLKNKFNTENISDANNFVFINNDKDRNIYLNIPLSQVASIKASDTKALVLASDSTKMTLSGAIITKGNIIIYNETSTDLVFNGPLISEKNILMYGSGKKIINSKSTFDSAGKLDSYSSDLLRAIATNENLFAASSSDLGKKVKVKTVSDGSHLTRSIDGNLDIDIIDNSEIMSSTINSNVFLEGIIKTNEAKTIHINSWKEID
ncbi:MAG: hypothetical protein WBA54_15645 [Acidaminobacteraceae bacterium]